MIWGVTIPWNLIASTALGIWLTTSPALFGTYDKAADSDHIFGALVVTTSITVMAEFVSLCQKRLTAFLPTMCRFLTFDQFL